MTTATPQGILFFCQSVSTRYAHALVPIMIAAPKKPSMSRKSVWKCEALKGGKGWTVLSAGALGREAVDEEGDVADVGDDAPLLELLHDGAGARDADMEALVRI